MLHPRMSRSSRLVLIVLTMLCVGVLLNIPSTAASLLHDAFDGASINTDIWSVQDTDSNLGQSAGYLEVRGGLDTPEWHDPSIYSGSPINRAGGRAFVNTFRPTIVTGQGSLFHLSPSIQPANPTETGHGIFFNTGNMSVPAYRAFAVEPGSAVPVDSRGLGGADVKTIRSIDYTTATVLRDSGAFSLISGGQFGTFPQATLVWVSNAGSDALLYPGISNYNDVAWVGESRIVDLGGSFASDYGLATVADSFDRSGSLDGTNPDLAGTGQTWDVVLDTIMTDGDVATATASSRAVVTGTADGIVEAEMTSPAADSFSGGVVFRYSDVDNYWLFYGTDTTYGLGYVQDGSFNLVTQTGATFFGHSNTKRFTVTLWGDVICPFVDGEQVLFQCAEHSFNNSATGVGIDTSGSNTVSFDNFAAWPRTVTLPDDAVTAISTVPNANTGTVLANDQFLDTGDLQSHSPDSGPNWIVYNGSWTISGNQAVPDDEGTIAIMNLDDTDVAVTVDLTLPAAGVGTTEWLAGLALRFQDDANYTWARFVWQDGSPEVEVWEVIEGVSSPSIMNLPGIINAVNVSQLLFEGGTHKLTFAAKGNQVAAYIDDLLVAQGTTSRLGGTGAGMVVGTGVSTPLAQFDNFTVYAAAADTVAPGPITDLQASATPTAAAPSLTWSEVLDDTTGADVFYRVYRSTVGGVIGAQINLDDSTVDGEFTDAGVVTSGTYYYTVRAVDSYDNESDSDENNQVAVVYDVAGPTGGVTIDAGATTTTSRTVTLAISATDNFSTSGQIDMQVSNVSSFSGATWEDFANSKSWTLTSGSGTKTVYVRFRDALLNVSSSHNDTISYTETSSSSSSSSATSSSSSSGTSSASSSSESSSISSSSATSSASTSLVSVGDGNAISYKLIVDVRYSDQQPVVDAKVTLEQLQRTQQTNSQGIAQFPILPAGSYTVLVAKDGAEMRQQVVLNSSTVNSADRSFTTRVIFNPTGTPNWLILGGISGIGSAAAAGGYIWWRKRYLPQPK